LPPAIERNVIIGKISPKLQRGAVVCMRRGIVDEKCDKRGKVLGRRSDAEKDLQKSAAVGKRYFRTLPEEKEKIGRNMRPASP